MLTWLTAERWSPYVVGAGIGVLGALSFLLSDKTIGCSTAFARTSGMIERLVRGRRAAGRPYYAKFPPVVDWEWLLVAGIAVGSFLSAILSGSFRPTAVPALWSDAVGPSVAVRLAAAFAGGIIMGFGARWAGGCTSGHGISGTMQLALSSWIAAVSFFATGVLTALFIYNVLFV